MDKLYGVKIKTQMDFPISVIVPTYNEEQCIAGFLNELKKHLFDEIIVVDGGSKDHTCEIAKKYTPNVYVSPLKGRAAQMNLGAAHAKHDILLFLHADTYLPHLAKSEILQGIRLKKCGRFRDSFTPANGILNFYAFFTRFQYFSYGDQAFFVNKEYFKQLQGFDEERPFEDIDFYKRLRKITKPYISPLSVTTSARRFTKVGVIKQALIDLLFIIMVECRLPTTVIHKTKSYLYRDIR
ncbi:TIGR04283 family arsenosugar biosynthesis glycosyltransferase [Candidatus Uabimicrobium amorphum]|uniref:Glycosyl transferase n=1 Tax=Uabimicrobium amorphum TaxID=2596890 RepID=A0A5S9F1T4_UABAM|nr:TIGR04283 family arsenosugar biosynthesis glycosyltransferase [Candidatus Uabimicrobium amorphum]BBM82742.1 glycosyl transferase [Candidatus Uabimicrobium amorphum]